MESASTRRPARLASAGNARGSPGIDAATPSKVRATPTAPFSRRDRDRIDWHRVDATGDAPIARQAAAGADTAPVSAAAADLLAAARRIDRPRPGHDHPRPRRRAVTQ
jgi:hypothetical protein